MKKQFLMMLLISLPAMAIDLGIMQSKYSYEKSPEYEAILSELKPYGSFSSKEIVSKTMSRGEQAVEEAKARNRAILAHQKERPVEKKEGLQAWKSEVKTTQENWKKEIQNTRAQWQREQEVFLGRLKVYKENTFVLPIKKEKIVEKKVPMETLPDAHIVNEAFAVPIRDQQARPTCSAFAGIRAIEVILSQHKIEKDLSEQYFYWASKPNCQSSPCSEKGSWVTPGLRHSQTQVDFDVPVEEVCSYKNLSIDKNETHIPLSNECSKGSIKILNYEEVRSLAEVIEKLKQDVPVILAAKLSENFYKNHGLVKLEESKSSGVKLDAHAKGHAFLGIGFLELPEGLRASEGNYCIVIANSWGKGWGAGGYSCLTEKWLTKFRQPSAFVAVTKISIR